MTHIDKGVGFIHTEQYCGCNPALLDDSKNTLGDQRGSKKRMGEGISAQTGSKNTGSIEHDEHSFMPNGACRYKGCDTVRINEPTPPKTEDAMELDEIFDLFNYCAPDSLEHMKAYINARKTAKSKLTKYIEQEIKKARIKEAGIVAKSGSYIKEHGVRNYTLKRLVEIDKEL
jgi:hypothetical protein